MYVPSEAKPVSVQDPVPFVSDPVQLGPPKLLVTVTLPVGWPRLAVTLKFTVTGWFWIAGNGVMLVIFVVVCSGLTVTVFVAELDSSLRSPL